jgi:peroxiredoxin/uncharacterized membrane protein YphA (DoxX/SURF4 family)
MLAVTFAVAGIAKLADPDGSRQSMLDFGMPAFLARPSAVLLPLAEVACALALIPVGWAWYGAVAVLVLLLMFIVGISISLARGRTPDCHCFGQLHSAPIGWKTLVRNGFLAGCAVLVILPGPGNSGASALGWISGLTGAQAAVAGLAVVVAIQMWIVFHMLRQNGRLLLRIESIESKLGISGGTPPPAGLAAGTPAPGFSLATLDDGIVTSEQLLSPGKPLLLVFTEPSCGACDALLPDVARWQAEYADRLSIVAISSGQVEANRIKAAEHKLRDVLLQSNEEASKAYLVEVTPTAVLIEEGKIASSLAAGVDQIRSLVTRATLPPPLKKGDRVPALEFPDLEGKTVDLGAARGRRTLLLFWSPSCGFCQRMLEDVKRWERTRSEEALELLVISAGSPKENREQGFRSTVLLDQHFSAGQVFGVGGTPAALILDPDGKVASEVRDGAEAVMAMAGGVSPK